MKFSNKGYWAIILGGSSGIGLATAKKLAQEGMNLCILHRDSRSSLDAFNEVLEEIRKNPIQCISHNVNALKDEVRAETIEELKSAMKNGEGVKVILHSIAKGNLKGMTNEIPDRNWSEIANLLDLEEGQIEGLKKYLDQSDLNPSAPLLKEDDYILTIQAMSVSYYSWVQDVFSADILAENALGIALTSEGNQTAWRNYGAVSAAKSSLESISRSIALELGPLGFRSNVIQAGVTNTPSLNMIPGSKVLKSNSLLKNPLNRMTTPEDIADVVSLLCMPEANWINGAIIPVDGGESIT